MRATQASPEAQCCFAADGPGDGAFVVAIRSAVAQHERIWLYAGCGIVAASVPRKEWAECELKLKPMMEAFGL